MEKNLFKSNLLWLSSLMIISTLFIACEDFLEESPQVQLSTDQFYQTESDAISGLSGAYAQLKDGVGYYRQQFLSNLHASSDQGLSSYKHVDFGKGTITSSDQNLVNPWNEMYIGIRDANNIIFNVPKIDMDEDLKARIIGEAKFLRALHYFNLVRCFGEVPLRTKPLVPGEEGLPVSPITDIYKVIIDDLTFASENCWGRNEIKNGYTNHIGRATNAAANALLSKVYLRIASAKRTAEEGDVGNAKYLQFSESLDYYYQKVIDHADATINQGDYVLVGDLESWVEIFSPANGNNTEMLFDIQGSSLTEQGTAVSNLFSPKDAGLSGGGWGGTNRLVSKYVNNQINKYDPRYQNSIIKNYQDTSFTYELLPSFAAYKKIVTETGEWAKNAKGKKITLYQVYTSKYIDSNATTEYTSEQNWHVIRLADVYLMRAEAKAELGEPADAMSDINALRQRVGAADLDLSNMSMEEFREALLRERGVELYMEGHRFFDLTRMGVYSEYCDNVLSTKDIDAKRDAADYFWPIPLTETSANENID
jgi:starch-binding outer membrane protein, SusD/RagB family